MQEPRPLCLRCQKRSHDPVPAVLLKTPRRDPGNISALTDSLSFLPLDRHFHTPILPIDEEGADGSRVSQSYLLSVYPSSVVVDFSY